MSLENSQELTSLKQWPPAGIKWYYSDKYVAIAHGDCREILPQLPDKSVDLVLTDPPYSKEYSYVWGELGKMGGKVLRDGKSLLTLCGHYQLADVIKEITQYLNYHWCCIFPNNKQPLMHGWNIKVCWKPILWFVQGEPEHHDIITDNFAKRGMRSQLWRGQDNHKWGQSEEMCYEPLLALTQENDLILDPFLGSGTTAFCAKKLNRKCIGIEIEERYAHIAAERCRQTVMDFPSLPTESENGESRALF